MICPELFLKVEFWHGVINMLIERHYILKSQKLYPERWRRFYNSVAPFVDTLWGDASSVAHAILDRAQAEGLLLREASVIDLGCGTGVLTLELAKRGYRVLAVDSSEGMINILRKKLPENRSVEMVCADFHEFYPGRLYDVCFAMNFPPLFSAQGVYQLEKYAHLRCCIVPVDEQLNPDIEFRRRIATDLLHARPTRATRLLAFWLVGFLWSRSIVPNVKTIEISSTVQIKRRTLLKFYTTYFRIFGIKDDIIQKLFLSFFGDEDSENECLKWKRVTKVCMVWW